MPDLPSQFGEHGDFGFIFYLVDTFILYNSFSSLWSKYDFLKASPLYRSTHLGEGDDFYTATHHAGRLLSVLAGTVNRLYLHFGSWVFLVVKYPRPVYGADDLIVIIGDHLVLDQDVASCL